MTSEDDQSESDVVAILEIEAKEAQIRREAAVAENRFYREAARRTRIERSEAERGGRERRTVVVWPRGAAAASGADLAALISAAELAEKDDEDVAFAAGLEEAIDLCVAGDRYEGERADERRND